MEDIDLKTLIGKIAVTESELNPCGIASIDNEIYEVRTNGEAVDAGRGVKVTRVQGKKIFVIRV
jgi:membrane-bound ClpP family serine protease